MAWNRAVLVLALPIWAACSHAKPDVKAEPPAAAAAPAQRTGAALPAAREAKPCVSDDECGTGELCVASRCQAIVADMPECAAASVHFEFDRSDLQESDAPLLRRAARCLEAFPSTRALVAGNCDERGTTEYNVALGFRRAARIEKYLEALGVPPARLRTVSYGKELPVCHEPTEECWGKNRRADISPGEKPQVPQAPSK